MATFLITERIQVAAELDQQLWQVRVVDQGEPEC